MDNLNRPLIKQQARQLISGNVFKLFIIQLVVSICMTGIYFGGYTAIMAKTVRQTVDFALSSGLPEQNGNADDFNNFGSGSENFADDFNNFGKGFEDFADDFSRFGNGIENFAGELPNYPDLDEMPYINENELNELYALSFSLVLAFMLLSFIGMIAAILFSPLGVSLSGLFVSFIRGKRFGTGDGIKTVFKNGFKNYGHYLGIMVLRNICIYFLSWLFIIPGIIYYYSTYFANQIMADNPNLSPSEALDLSKKIAKGNRWELFVMNLSFIGWFILCGLTFGIAYIYVMPYMEATNALYYENFRLRAIQQGRVTEDDFLSAEQKFAKYANNYYGQPYQQNTPYGSYNQPNGQYAPYTNAPQQSNPYYYAPQQNTENANPQPAAAVNEAPQDEAVPFEVPAQQKDIADETGEVE